MKKIKAISVIVAAGVLAASMTATTFAANVMTAARFQAAYPRLSASNPFVSAVVSATGGRGAAGRNATADGFNAAEYAEMYPDVVAIVGMNPQALYQHYLMHGRTEGRFVNKAAKTQADKVSGKSSSTTNRFNSYGRVSAPGSTGRGGGGTTPTSGSSNSESRNRK